jgi:hypothetical protein
MRYSNKKLDDHNYLGEYPEYYRYSNNPVNTKNDTGPNIGVDINSNMKYLLIIAVIIVTFIIFYVIFKLLIKSYNDNNKSSSFDWMDMMDGQNSTYSGDNNEASYIEGYFDVSDSNGDW